MALPFTEIFSRAGNIARTRARAVVVDDYCDQRLPQFPVGKINNILKVTEDPIHGLRSPYLLVVRDHNTL